MNNREQDKIWWEKQKNGNWKNLTKSLAQDLAVHSRFNNFIKKFYWQFRLKKGIPRGSYSPEINFQGFKEFIISQKELGTCFSEQKDYYLILKIVINQAYLLNKLGMERYVISNPNDLTYSYWNTHFEDLIKTIAHELAHAYQYTINLKKEGEKSSCESSGKRDTDGIFLYPELVTEHTQLTKEIEQMIVASTKYQEFKNWWTNQQSLPEMPEKDEEEEFEKLVTLLKRSKDLLDLEKNYLTIKKNPFYSRDENTLGRNENNKQFLDNCYNEKVIDLRSSSTNSPNNASYFNSSLWMFILILWGIALLLTGLFIISGSKKRTKKQNPSHFR